MPKKKDIWKQIVQSIQSNYKDTDIETWFRGTSLKALSPKATVIRVPNRFVGIWIRDHFIQDIREAFSKICGYKPEISCSYPQAVTAPQQSSKSRSIGQTLLSALSPILPQNTFESFILDDHNRFACKAALSVSKDPFSQRPAPLLIFSTLCSGKTHLLHAIANRLLQRNTEIKVGYVSTGKFISTLQSIEENSTPKRFEHSFLDLDVLLVDDIHHLSGHITAQLALLTIVDAFACRRKALVFSSSRPPNLIHGLDRHLASRIQSGVLAEISGVEQRTRFSIAKNMLAREMVEVSDDIIFYLANLTEDISQLLTYTNIVANHALNRKSVELSQIRKLISSVNATQITPHLIIQTVAQYYGVEASEILSGSRNRRICHCRHVAMYLCKEILKTSLKEIANHLGKLNHSSVLYGVRKVEQGIKTNRQILQAVTELKRIITYC